MDISELKAILERSHDTAARSFALDPAALGPTPIRLLLEPEVGLGALALSETRAPKVTQAAWSIAGQARIWGVPDVPARMEFRVHGGKAQVLVEASLPGDWRFADSFAELQATLFDKIVPAEGTGITAYFSSRPVMLPVQGGGKMRLVRGAGVRIAVGRGDAEPFATLAHLVPGAEALEFLGPVTRGAHGVEMELALTGELSVAGLFPQIASQSAARLVSRFGMAGEVRLAEQRVEVSVDLPLGDSHCTAVAALGNHRGGLLDLRADFAASPEAAPGLDALGALLGGDDLGPALSGMMPEGFGLSLHQIAVGLDPRAPAVRSVRVRLGALEGRALEVIAGHVTLGALGLEAQVIDPFAPGRQFSLHLSGEISLPADAPILQLDAYADLPGTRIGAVLREHTDFDLTALVAHYIPAAADVPALVFTNLSFDAELAGPGRGVQLSGALGTTWDIALPGGQVLSVQDVAFEVEDRAGAPVRGALGGTLGLGGVEVQLRAEFGARFVLTGTVPELDLGAALEALGGYTLPGGFPELDFGEITVQIAPGAGEVSFSARSRGDWEIGIGPAGLTLSDVSVAVRCMRGADGGKQVEAEIGGTLDIGGAKITLACAFPGAFELRAALPEFKLARLLSTFCGDAALRLSPMPPALMDLTLSDIELVLAPGAGSVSLLATSPMGRTELLVRKSSSGGWGFGVGIAPPDTWQFSRIDPALVVLDPLGFSGTALFITSEADGQFRPQLLESGGEMRIRKGLNLYCTLDMTGLGVDELLDIRSLGVHAAIGADPRKLILEARIDGQFPLAENVTFGDITFRLEPNPTAFAVTLLGTVTTRLDDSALDFVGGLGIRAIATPPSFAARLQATMLGRWENPFGADGLALENVALDLGIGFPPIRPAVGVAGTLQVGQFEGSAAVLADTINPAQSMLQVGFNRLDIGDVIDTFAPRELAEAIPEAVRTTVSEISFSDVDVRIVPQPTRIGELEFEKGISLAGAMQVWGLDAHGIVKIDPAAGLYIEAQTDPINLEGVLVLTGAAGDPKPRLLVDLRLDSTPGIEITAAASVMGIARDVKLVVSDTGFFFSTSGTLFDLFEARLEISGQALGDSSSLYVKATMQNDLLAYLRTEALEGIKAAADEALSEIREAQETLEAAQVQVDTIRHAIEAMRETVRRERARDIRRLQEAQAEVGKAQRKVEGLDRDIANMRRIVQGERERDARRLADARGAVATAQAKVNTLQGQIDRTRSVIRNERARDTARIEAARRKVASAQRDVDTLNGEISSTKARIRAIDGEIRAKKRWLDGKAWYDKIWAGPEYAAYESGKRIEQGALYTKIGGIETAKHTAQGVLELAKQTLRGIEQAARTVPIDADPRIAGLFTAREAASRTLDLARQTLRGIEAAAKSIPVDADPRIAGLLGGREIASRALQGARALVHRIEQAARSFPIDADPRVVALFGARESATAGLDFAHLTLEGARESVGAAAQVGTHIVNFGLGGIIDIREASFEGGLALSSGGRVAMRLGLSFMDEPMVLALDFDFQNPALAVRDLVDHLLS